MMPNMSIWPRRRLHLSERLVQDDPQRRIALLIAVTGLIIGILAAAAIVSALIVETHWSSSDKATVIGDVIAGATLLLAVVAGLVAVLAYAVSTGAPDLRVRVGSAGNPFGYPRIQLKDGEDLNSPRDYELIIMLKNISSYSARNPVVTVRAKGLTFLDVGSGAWETIERNFFPLTRDSRLSGMGALITRFTVIPSEDFRPYDLNSLPVWLEKILPYRWRRILVRGCTLSSTRILLMRDRLRERSALPSNWRFWLRDTVE